MRISVLIWPIDALKRPYMPYYRTPVPAVKIRFVYAARYGCITIITGDKWPNTVRG